MADKIEEQAVWRALSAVKFPGFDADIVALGLVEKVSAESDGKLVVVLRHPAESDSVIYSVAERCRAALATEGAGKIEIHLRKLPPELGEGVGKVELEGVRHVVAVASGKGGVGKSTVAANLAVALAQHGFRTGLLDADIYGPSMPTMFGLTGERPQTTGTRRLKPAERYGVKLVSIGLFLGERAPVIWRGPLVMGAVRQFLTETDWGELDFLVVDLPPGTGDAQITLAQQAYLDGVLMVTTPQEVALLDVERAVQMFRQVHCPLLGIVENMSYFVCPDCGEREELFGHGGGERLAQNENVKLLARVPIYPELCASGDSGVPIAVGDPDHPVSRIFHALAAEIAADVRGEWAPEAVAASR